MLALRYIGTSYNMYASTRFSIITFVRRECRGVFIQFFTFSNERYTALHRVFRNIMQLRRSAGTRRACCSEKSRRY